MQRIGVLGGMMDPVHLGHIGAAGAALNEGLDLVLLAPCQTPAHRPAALVSAAHRLEMCRLAAAENPRIQASDVDLRDDICYAADTVRLLQKQYPEARICWIVGADKLPSLPRWREADYLFSHCDFYICPRAGFDANLPVPGATLHIMHAPAQEISSAMAIARLQALEDAPDLLPAAVSRYIALHGLYQPDYVPVLRRYGMGDHRLQHTLGVRQTAVDLAQRHGASMQAAAVAAMLHDIAKPLPLVQMQALARRYLPDLDDELMADGNLLHGPVAAAIAKNELGVTHEAVLSAIACHTTGKAGMSTLDKVLFIADAIEPNRRDYPGLAEMRALAPDDLDAAVLCSMRRTREYVLSRGDHFCSHTERAMQYLLQQKEEKI